MFTSVNLLAFLVALMCFMPIGVNIMLARLSNNPKLSNLALIKDLLKKRAAIAEGKRVYIFDTDRRIWLKEVEKCLRETR